MPDQVTCQVCHAPFAHDDTVGTAGIRLALLAKINATAGPVNEDSRVCRKCLFALRTDDLVSRLAEERGSLSAIERELAKKATQHETVAANIDEDFTRTASLADRAADAVARIGGSWFFVIGMCAIIAVWMTLNGHEGKTAHDPFPFILLNLALSCVAALQAPILLMSANRHSSHDRRKADQDFLVNLKAEIEVASLHEKLDHLLHVQWEQLLEVQDLQIEMLETLVAHGKPPTTPPLGPLAAPKA